MVREELTFFLDSAEDSSQEDEPEKLVQTDATYKLMWQSFLLFFLWVPVMPILFFILLQLLLLKERRKKILSYKHSTKPSLNGTEQF